MSRDVGLRGADIELHACAVGDENRTIDFHVVTGPDEHAETWSRLSSTRVRTNVHAPWLGAFTMQTEPVPMVRLDSILAGNGGSIALWIDVEGGAYDVLRGAHGVLDRVRAVHVEVEMTELWAGQKTAPEVLDLLHRRDFELVARKTGEFQRDLLFLRIKPFRVSTFAAVLMLLSLRALLPVWRAIRPKRRLLSSTTGNASDASRVT